MKKERVHPVAGATFELAAKVHVDTLNRRKLLLLLAGYADAGERSPTMSELSRRVGVSPTIVDTMLDSLVKTGLLEVQWAGNPANPPGRRQGPRGARNVYTLVIDNIAEAA